MENIKYTLTIDDIKDYTKYLYKIPRMRKLMMQTYMRVYIVLFICMLVCFWSIIDGGQINWGNLSLPVFMLILKYFLAALLVCLFICTALWFISTRDLLGTSARATFRYLKGQSLDMELQITDEGLRCSNGNSSGIVKLDGIIDIYKSKKSIFIFTGKYIAYIVPLRAFERKEEFDCFFYYIKEKIKNDELG